MGIRDLLALHPQIPQDAGTDALGLVRDTLAVAESLRAALEPVGAREELLALVDDCIAGPAVATTPEERVTLGVLRKLEERMARDVEVVRVVAEPRLDLVASTRGDV